MDQSHQQQNDLLSGGAGGSSSGPRGSNMTTMKLRVNFPDTEQLGLGSGFSSDTQVNNSNFSPSASSAVSGLGTESSSPRRGSLLLEGMMKAMQQQQRGPATYEAEEDDCYPEGATPWFLDTERRDSIEHTRSKLAHGRMGGGGGGGVGGGKGRLQRDRKRLRDHKAMRPSQNEARQAADDCGFDEEDVEEQTKKNTEYNEYLHPLMRSVANAEQLLAQHYPDLLRGPGAGSHQQAIPYAMASSLPSSSSQYSNSTVSDETSSTSSLDPTLSAMPPSHTTSVSSAHAVLDELDKELSALVEGLGDMEF